MLHNRHSININDYYLGKKRNLLFLNGIKIILKFSYGYLSGIYSVLKW